MKRTDIHRPSAIDPSEYEFVGVEYDKTDDLDSAYSLAWYREQIQAHMQRTGGHYSRHRHGGNCHVCGAHCIYTALFWHAPTNTYIRTGFDCAEKMDVGDPAMFRAFRAAVDDARQLKAGKHKARAVLADAGLTRAWELHELTEAEALQIGAIVRTPSGWCGCKHHWKPHLIGTHCATCDQDVTPSHCEYRTKEYEALQDIIGRLIQYGNISEKAIRYLAVLVDKIDNRAAREAEEKARREAEHQAAAPAPTGRIEFTGRPVSLRRDVGQYGVQTKWLLVTAAGWKTWGTVPSSLEAELYERGLIRRGREYDDPPKIDRDTPFTVRLTATITPSKDDPKFSFYSRPAKAALLMN